MSTLSIMYLVIFVAVMCSLLFATSYVIREEEIRDAEEFWEDYWNEMENAMRRSKLNVEKEES